MTANEKYEKLIDTLKTYGKVAVCFSAGVDSTLLLLAAKRALGEGAVALTAVSPVLPEAEQKQAEEFCEKYGVRLIKIDVSDTLEKIRNNPADRCYICKKSIMTKIIAAAKAAGIKTVAEGSNLDDGGDNRPGMRAVEELGIISPLKQVGLTKREIRETAKSEGLSCWNKPAYACLATRFPFGEELTAQKLLAVEKAEDFLHEKGFLQVRVRAHGNIARIETAGDDFEKLNSPALRKEVSDKLLSLGFSFVSLDLSGYKTGNMNKA